MKKTLTLLWAFIFVLITSVIQAQSLESEGTPLITNASQLSSNASDEAEGQHIEFLLDGDASTFWHTDWHNKVKDQYHYLQVALNEEHSGDAAIWIIRRSTDNDHPTQFLVQASVDGSNYIDIATVDVPFQGSGTTSQSDFFTMPEHTMYLRFNATNATGSSYGYRKYWHAAEFQVYIIEHDAQLKLALQNVLLKYDAYLWGETFNMGTAYGQYTDTEAEATFLENLKKVDDILANMDDEGYALPTAEEVEALIQTVEDAHAAILASEVLYQIPSDGYYRIYTHLPYYKDVATGEKDGEGADIVDRQFITKAMYSDLAGYASWGTYDDADCRFLWKLTKDVDNPTIVDFYNAATEYRIKEWGNPITMAEDGQLKVIFDWVGNENEHDVFYIRNSALDRNPSVSNYLHQWSHNRGAGTGYQLCAWRGTYDMGVFYETDKGTSEWYMEPVNDEEAQALIASFAPYKDHDLMVLQYKNVITQAEAAILKSKDASLMTNINYDQPLITETSQFSSPVTESTEGAIANLLDGDASTFWHSDWHGNFPDPIHYLNVELNEEYQGVLSLYMARRAGCANDHPIKMQVGASNDGETWIDIAQITAPFDGNTSVTYFTPFTLTEPYKYVRFGALDCTGDSQGYRTYWHAGEIQLYPATIAGHTQFETMGDVATNLSSLIEKGKAKADADISVSDFDALKDAYEAFMALLVDPSELTAALNTARTELKCIQIGNAPGFWTDETPKAQAQTLIDEVQAYTQSGKFDKATVSSYIQQLQNVKASIIAQANKPLSNKWYRIRHMNKDEYTLCGATTGYTNLYGQYIAVGHRETEIIDDAQVEVAYAYNTDETREGQNIYFFDEDQIKDMDVAMFRFVELPDGRYAIQNKASGLYISRSYEDAEILLGFGPQSFEIQPIGYGQVLLVMKALDGTTYTRPNLNAHSSEYGSLLKWWNDTAYGCNSTFIIEEAEDVEADYTPIVKMNVTMGKYYPMCYPESVLPTDGTVYEVVGTFTDDGKDYVAMDEVNGASQAGIPFVYMLGTPEDYDEETPENLTVEFTLGTNFNLTPGSKGGFQGTYSYKWVDNGTIVFDKNRIVGAEGAENTDCTRDVFANTGYINFGAVDADAENAGNYALVVEINGEVNREAVHTGTADDPYELSSVEDLLAMKDKIMEGKLTYFILNNDIDLAEVENWEAFGIDPYAWVDFDGQGHVIKNLTSKSEEGYGYPSFFGVLCGNVRNVGFENVNIEGNGGCGVLGGYIGHSTYTIDGVAQTCYVENVWATGKLHVKASYGGGLAGNIGGPTVIKNCYVNMEVTGDIDLCGAIIGRVRGSINMENVYAAGSCNKSGIVGGGQNDSTPTGSYKNIVVWNNTDQNFGATASADVLDDITYFDGNNFAELQKKVTAWGDPWYCGMANNEYPTFRYPIVADLFDVVFNEDGTAMDVSPMQTPIQTIGTPSVVFNEKVGTNIFDQSNKSWGGTPDNIFYFTMTNGIWKALSDGFTMECYICPTWNGENMPDNWISTFGFEQGGGTGMIIENGKWIFESHIGSGYKSVKQSGVPVKNEWIHLTGVWDKKEGKSYLYVNGTLDAQLDAVGDLNKPGVSEENMYLGADVTGSGTPDNSFQGQIAILRLYDKALTSDEVSRLYGLATENGVGIQSTTQSTHIQNAIYNIMGQKVMKTQKGLYIIDGKKVMVK